MRPPVLGISWLYALSACIWPLSAPLPIAAVVLFGFLCLSADSYCYGDFTTLVLLWSLQFLPWFHYFFTTIRTCKSPLMISGCLHPICRIWHRIIVRKYGFFRFSRQPWCILPLFISQVLVPSASFSRLVSLWSQSSAYVFKAHQLPTELLAHSLW